MAKENENALDPKIVERLNGLDWDGLKASTGISREAVEKNPVIARQLAYGSMTDLVAGHTEDVSGFYSLRAIPSAEEDKLGRIKAYTIEPEKKPGMTLFLYGSPIYSDKALDNLFEMTTIKTLDKEGKEITVRINANENAGVQIAVKNPETGEKTKYLVSIHQPTNRIVGVPVEAVEKMLANASVYGVALNDEQKKALVDGKAIIVNGCKTKDGETFSACVQFNAAKRQLVNAHPTWLKEAQKAGIDTGVSTRAAAKKEESKGEGKKAEKAEKAEKKVKTSKSIKH